MNLPDFKSAIIAQMISTTQEKIDLSKAQITSIQQSKSSETKSTAGDKHETGRAMMETELAFAQSALTKSLQQLADIEKLAESGASDIVEFGSLVETSKGFSYSGVSRENFNSRSVLFCNFCSISNWLCYVGKIHG